MAGSVQPGSPRGKHLTPRLVFGLLAGFAAMLLTIAFHSYWTGSYSPPTGMLPSPATATPTVQATIDSPEAVEFAMLRERIAQTRLPPTPSGSHLRSSAQPTPIANEQLSGLLRTLFENPSTVEPTKLGRYTEVNPHGIPLLSDQQLAFEVLHRQCVAPLSGMLVLMPRLQLEELESLAHSGRLRPLSLSSKPEIQKEVQDARAMNAKLGIAAEPMFRGSRFYDNAKGLEFFCRVDGQVFGASRHDLVRSTERDNFYLEAVVTSYNIILAYANAIGLLDDHAIAEALVATEKWRDRHRHSRR